MGKDWKFTPEQLGGAPTNYGWFLQYRKNNVRIEGKLDKKNKHFYLDYFEAQNDKDKPRAEKGEANFYLCEFIKYITKTGELGLTRDDDIELEAGQIDMSLKRTEAQKQGLINYYKKLGFEPKKTIRGAKEDRFFTQKISSFLNNCKKFDDKK